MVHNLPLLITTISLQIVGVRFPGPILKLLATAIGLYTLLYYATSKPTGPYLDVWVFGMNLWGVVVKAINIFWFRRAEELKRAPRPVARAHSFPLDKTSNAYVGSKNWIQGIRKLIDNVKLFLGELAEAAEELLTLRGVGWNFQAKGIPEPPAATYPRYRFVLEQLLGIWWRHTLLDLGRAWINSTSLGTFPLIKMPTDYPVLVRMALGGYTMLHTRWTLDMVYKILAAVSVACSITDPCQWPPLFGSWSDAWTIRRFWAHTWHQMMRLHAEPPVAFVIHKVLRLPKGNYFSRWGKVFGNFAVAALLHAYGRNLAYGNTRRDWDMFLAHAVAIWMEDHVGAFILSLGIVTAESRICRTVGYIWTFGVTLWTWYFFMEEMIRAGGIAEPVMGVSAWDFFAGSTTCISGNQILVK